MLRNYDKHTDLVMIMYIPTSPLISSILELECSLNASDLFFHPVPNFLRKLYFVFSGIIVCNPSPWDQVLMELFQGQLNEVLELFTRPLSWAPSGDVPAHNCVRAPKDGGQRIV